MNKIQLTINNPSTVECFWSHRATVRAKGEGKKQVNGMWAEQVYVVRGVYTQPSSRCCFFTYYGIRQEGTLGTWQ